MTACFTISLRVYAPKSAPNARGFLPQAACPTASNLQPQHAILRSANTPPLEKSFVFHVRSMGMYRASHISSAVANMRYEMIPGPGFPYVYGDKTVHVKPFH